MVLEIARQELTIALRNRWTLIIALIFGVLLVSISYVGMLSEGFSGVQTFTRTTSSIMNLVLYLVPLFGLIAGTVAFTGDRGSTELLYAQPLSRSTVAFGKILGVQASIAVSTFGGFLCGAVVIAIGNGVSGIGRYAAMVGFALLLSQIFVGISFCISVIAHRTSKAFGMALGAWFFFVLLYDLLAIGLGLVLRGSSVNMAIFLSLFGNPVDIVRVATLLLLENASSFGVAGAALQRFLGGSEVSVLVLVLSLFVWVAMPIILALRALRRQDL